ncbi:MAG TPA: beta-L-arabinofuranosidase domain-containing protein, partial [Anaerolineales bacterium]|nr:beta-L-arabinofuranosidase domain-containing protein [Anaerolineales bacterium]
MKKQIVANVFSPDRVRLLDGPFRDAMLRTRSVLLALDPERLLRPFRLTAGLPSNAAPLGGWESPEGELRGHTLGHYLSASAWMAAGTGESEFKQRIDHIVNVLTECQAALVAQASHPGYLAAFPESFFDRVERRDPVWAPYYTLHKILSGLLDAYRIVGNHQALEIATGIAAWIRSRVDRLTFEQMQITLLNEPGGMNAVLAELYVITRDPEHLRLSLAFNDEVVLQPLAQGEDRLDRLHANTQIPKIIGVACQYETNGDPALRTLAEFFWEQVALRRSYVIGGNSDDELFFPVERFDQHLSSVTAETCNTYNMLKLTQHLFSWKPSARTMDFYERALFNHILGSQDPETGRTIYFASLNP